MSQPPPQSEKHPIEYTSVLQSGTNNIQALKFMRPSTEPATKIGAIAAKTN